MRLPSFAILTAALALGANGAAAQDDRDLLPMSFVRADTAISKQLEADWAKLSGNGREWAYCVTNWTLNTTQDADTIYVIRTLRRATVRTDRPHEIAQFTCIGKDGRSQPIAHAHPGGDCSPSRADATYAVAHGTPFALIICGPRSTSGYTAQQFLWISRGVLTERGAFIATDGSRP